jgi:hypothetical protein
MSSGQVGGYRRRSEVGIRTRGRRRADMAVAHVEAGDLSDGWFPSDVDRTAGASRVWPAPDFSGPATSCRRVVIGVGAQRGPTEPGGPPPARLDRLMQFGRTPLFPAACVSTSAPYWPAPRGVAGLRSRVVPYTTLGLTDKVGDRALTLLDSAIGRQHALCRAHRLPRLRGVIGRQCAPAVVSLVSHDDGS